jgi:REP element-mobilizing transposase RayT
MARTCWYASANRDRQEADSDSAHHEKLPARQALFLMTYLLTIACYGSHLPGQDGIVDKHHNIPGTPVLEPNPDLVLAAKSLMRQAPFIMAAEDRRTVRNSIREICRHKGWGLLAVHVRTNHLHSVVEADVTPEAALNVLKCYTSRALNLASPGERGRIRWARHGSTRYLKTSDAIEAAVEYVLAKQGETMAAYHAPPRSAS